MGVEEAETMSYSFEWMYMIHGTRAFGFGLGRIVRAFCS